MYLSTKYISTQNVLKYILKYFLSTLLISSGAAFTAALHTEAVVLLKKKV